MATLQKIISKLKLIINLGFLVWFVSSSVFAQESVYQPISYKEDYWKQSQVPLLGQLIPVNQINLQKGVHLFDVEMLGKHWQGLTNPFDTMGLGSFSADNHETLMRLRYAFPLARYTYIGVTFGFASRWEAELYDESGLLDPEIFIGQHIPWRNGNFRLSLSASPSLGPAEVTRKITVDQDSANGNFYRGGWSIRPEASITARVDKVLLGVEASYLYLGDRTMNESVSASSDVLQDPAIMSGLAHQYLGVNSTQTGYNSSYGASGMDVFAYGDPIQTLVTGGHAWAIKGLIEIPDWSRLGGEIIYGQVDASTRKNDFNREVFNEGGAFQEIRVYGRYKFNDQMSLTPLISWMPSLPLTRGQERMSSTSDVWGLQLTFRSKFEL